MQKIIYLFAIVCFSFQLNAQKISEKKVPQKVKDAFVRLYPDIKTDLVEWSKEVYNFEASFEMYKMDNSVTFDEEGKVLQTENGIPISLLRKEISLYVSKKYTKEKMKGASKITDEKGVISFEVELKNLELFFDENGAFLREEKMKKE